MRLEVGEIAECLAVEAVVLDVLDGSFDLALALGVVALASADAESGGGGLPGETGVEP